MLFTYLINSHNNDDKEIKIDFTLYILMQGINVPSNSAGPFGRILFT